MTSDFTTWTFTYNADSIRTKRTNGSTTYTYVYNGGSLSQMTVGNKTLYFAYDANGAPMSVTYNGTAYYYATNLQGDVVAILTFSDTAVVRYTYGAWSKLLTTTGTMASTLGVHNPLRYRSYVYDTDREGHYPSHVLEDKIYRNRENPNYCKEHRIHLSDPALGRPRKNQCWIRTRTIWMHANA